MGQNLEAKSRWPSTACTYKLVRRRRLFHRGPPSLNTVECLLRNSPPVTGNGCYVAVATSACGPIELVQTRGVGGTGSLDLRVKNSASFRVRVFKSVIRRIPSNNYSKVKSLRWRLALVHFIQSVPSNSPRRPWVTIAVDGGKMRSTALARSTRSRRTRTLSILP